MESSVPTPPLTPPSSPIQEETTPQTKLIQPESHSRWLILGMTVLILLLLLSTGYLAYQNMQLNNELARTGAVAPSPAPTATMDPTADWETYSNNIVGYTLKYPPGWGYEPGETYDTTGIVIFDTATLSQTSRGEDLINYQLHISLDTIENYQLWSRNAIQTQNLGVETINNKVFEKYVVGDLGYSLNYVYKKDGENIVRLLVYPYETDLPQPLPNGLQEIIEQILSTFEFTD